MWAVFSVLVCALVASSGGVRLLMGGVGSLSIVDTDDESLEVIANNVSDVVISLDYHMEKGYIFYIDFNSGLVKRLNTKGNAGTTKVIADINDKRIVPSLVVDWIKDVVYWACYRYCEVEMADLDGNGRTTVFNQTDFLKIGIDCQMTKLRYLAIDPHQRVLFMGFVSYSTLRDNNIVRGDLKSRELKKITLEEGKGFHMLAIDVGMKRLYTMPGQPPHPSDALYYCDYDGKDVKRIEMDNSYNPVFSVFQNHFYLTRVESIKNENQSHVNTATFKTNSSTALQYKPLNLTLSYKVFDMRVYEPQAQLSTACSQKRCSYLCRSSLGRVRCYCPPGMMLREDQETCYGCNLHTLQCIF